MQGKQFLKCFVWHFSHKTPYISKTIFTAMSFKKPSMGLERWLSRLGVLFALAEGRRSVLSTSWLAEFINNFYLFMSSNSRVSHALLWPLRTTGTHMVHEDKAVIHIKLKSQGWWCTSLISAFQRLNEARCSQVQGQPRIHNETLLQRRSILFKQNSDYFLRTLLWVMWMCGYVVENPSLGPENVKNRTHP